MNRQLNRDESDLENINVKARPMKISEDYEIFCSQQWLDAKDKLDREGNLDEKGRCELLCNIMEVGVFIFFQYVLRKVMRFDYNEYKSAFWKMVKLKLIDTQCV